MKNILIPVFLFCIGCSLSTTQIDGTTLPFSEIEIPLKNNEDAHVIYKPLETDDTICGFYFMERTDNNLYKFDINKNKVVKVFTLSTKFGRLDDFTIDNDTIYALKYPNGEIVLQNLFDSSTYRKYSLNNQNEFWGYSIEKTGNSIYVQSFPNVVLNTIAKTTAYYKKPLDNIVLISNGKLVTKQKFAPFPPMYHEGKYADCLHGIRCITDSNILYSYDYSESLDIYTLNGEKKMNSVPFSGEHFFLPPEFDYQKIQDLNYGYDYWNKTSAFTELIYNPWKKELYRILNHKSPTFSKLPSSKPWTLLVGHPENGPKSEVIYPAFKYKNYSIIPSRTGYIIPCLPVNNKDTSNIKLHVFTLY